MLRVEPDTRLFHFSLPTFEGIKAQRRYKSHGVNATKHHDEYSTPLGESEISRTLTKNEYIDDVAKSLGTKYCRELKQGSFGMDGYFDKTDEAYDMVNEFYTGFYGSRNYDCNMIDLERYFNIVRRGCLNKSKKHENGSVYLSSYTTGTKIGNVDSIKTMAWAVTHAYLTACLVDPDYIFEIIPDNCSNDVQYRWNYCIQLQTDVPQSVKDLFRTKIGERTIPEATTVTPELNVVYPDQERAFEKNDFVDVQFIDLNNVNGEAEKEEVPPAPVQNVATVPLEQSEPATVKVEEPVMTGADVSDLKEHEAPKETVAEDNYEYFAESDDTANGIPQQMSFGDCVAKMKIEGTVNPAVVASIYGNANKVTPETLPQFIQSNNQLFNMIPKVNAFTSYVAQAGKQVIYGQDVQFRGLIKAQIIDSNGDITRELRLDPCMMYGDTLRVITTDNAKGDIRRESFIPISNKEMVMAAIEGPLTSKQRKSLNEVLPRCLGDFRPKYSYLDRIDMRGIIDPKRPELVGLPFGEWRALVTNISNVIKDLPKNCRMRVSEYKDPDNFQLVADDKVQCCYPSNIILEPENIQAIQNKFFITATSDSSKKGVPGFFYTGPEQITTNTEAKAG